MCVLVSLLFFVVVIVIVVVVMSIVNGILDVAFILYIS